MKYRILIVEDDPVIAGAVKQFWTDVIWGDVDCLFVDMPPGTGDVPLTVFQSLPVDGIVVVTTPQDLVSMIVTKAVKMAEMMHIPVLGLVENYSYFRCPDCGKEHAIFGESHIERVAADLGLKVESRPVEAEELSTFSEAGACGTAAVISPIGSIYDPETHHTYTYNNGEPGEWSKKLYHKLRAIQHGEEPDTHGWNLVLE